MEQGYLLDTNIVIYLLHGRLNDKTSASLEPIPQNKPNISIISKIELLSWKEDLEIAYNFVESSNVLPIDDNIADVCIDIRNEHHIKIPDALIASTSIQNKLKLLTRNVTDFKKIKGLAWSNPFRD